MKIMSISSLVIVNHFQNSSQLQVLFNSGWLDIRCKINCWAGIKCFVAHYSHVLHHQGMEVAEDQGVPGAVEGEAEYAVVQGVFATGFSVPGRTTPGFAIRCKRAL